MVTRPAGFGPLTAPIVNDSFLSHFQDLARDTVFTAERGHRYTGGPNGSSRYTVFVSRSDGLAGDDNDTFDNVYVRDAVNNTTTLVSRASGAAGAAANGASGDPAISADGQHVVFVSTATNLVPNIDTNGTEQVYERDLQSATTTLVSRATGGAGVVANDDSGEPSVSGDGSVVAFSSRATNLPGASTSEQVYVRAGSSTSVVSVKSGTATPGSLASFAPSLDDNGDVVAFTTYATDFGVSDNNGQPDVYIHRLGTGVTLLASVETIAPTPGAYGNDGSAGASISADGSRVAFASAATNFSTNDSDSNSDVYVHDFGSNTTSLVSQTHSNVKGDKPSYNASISADGGAIAFITASDNLTSADTNGVADVYVNTGGLLGGTALASRCQSAALLTAPVGEEAIAPAGNLVAFSTGSRGCSPQADDDFNQVYTRALGIIIGGTEPTTLISRPSGTGDFKSHTNDSATNVGGRSASVRPVLSADGSVAAFVSESDELSPDDNDGVSNIYVRENRTGITELISRASGANGAPGDDNSGESLNGRSLPLEGPSISADGRYVAFASSADNLVPGDTNKSADIFVRDRAAQTTTRVSVTSNGAQADDNSFEADISADGSRVAFATDAVLDPAHDTAGKTSVYVRDLAAGTTTLVSRQSDPGTFDANDNAGSPSISGDGTRVAFVTAATNLAPSIVDGNAKDDVYVRDLGTNLTRLGSARDGAQVASTAGATAPDLDGTGTHLAFESASDDMAGTDGNGFTDVFVRDLTGTATTLISHGPGGAAGNGPSYGPSLSGDGTRVAFDTAATDLIAGDANTSSEVLVRDLTAGSLSLASRADGAGGAQPEGRASSASISSDGHCVSFDSDADNLVPGTPVGTDFTHGYMRALDGDCGTPPPPPAPPGPTPDTTAPVITGLKVTPSKLHRGSKKGVKITFKLSEAAKVSLKIELKGKGRKKGSKCLATRRTGKRCTLYKAKATLRRSGKLGANTIAFSGRIGKHRLANGSYRITATATDPAGNKAKRKTATFNVVA
jgi:hypothetical protein